MGEVADAWYWTEKGSLAAMWGADGRIPVALRQGIKAFDAGYQREVRDRMDRSRK